MKMQLWQKLIQEIEEMVYYDSPSERVYQKFLDHKVNVTEYQALEFYVYTSNKQRQIPKGIRI